MEPTERQWIYVVEGHVKLTKDVIFDTVMGTKIIAKGSIGSTNMVTRLCISSVLTLDNIDTPRWDLFYSEFGNPLILRAISRMARRTDDERR